MQLIDQLLTLIELINRGRKKERSERKKEARKDERKKKAWKKNCLLACLRDWTGLSPFDFSGTVDRQPKKTKKNPKKKKGVMDWLMLGWFVVQVINWIRSLRRYLYVFEFVCTLCIYMYVLYRYLRSLLTTHKYLGIYIHTYTQTDRWIDDLIMKKRKGVFFFFSSFLLRMRW